MVIKVRNITINNSLIIFKKKVKPKHVSKAREVLNKHFEYLSGGARLVKKNKGVDAVDDELEANLALLMGEKDYAPFVFFPMSAPA